jgi:ribonuclease E
MRKMLINATESEETRIAITKDNKLFDLDIENINHEQKKANIYKGKISRIEPSLNAIFVSYGEDKNGFLPFKEVSPEYFNKPYSSDDENNVPPMQDLLKVGQEIIIQINKEERGTKGAALTTYITLAGCYLVLMPNNIDGGGISRRIEGEDRQKLKSIMNSLNIPTNMSVIIRTAGVGKTSEDIQWDVDILVKLWSAIKTAASNQSAPLLIHRESDIMIRAIRDYLRDDISEIITDTQESHDDIKRQLKLLRPDFLDKLTLFKSTKAMFTDLKIESQIETAFQREVRLPSGGSIVIDATEALTAVDVNSAKATRRDNIEETAFHTNLEAADEIARQMKLRDIGGLIIIDFIDMSLTQNQKKIEEGLADILQHDRAKIQMTRISKFGLVEVSRQRMRPSLGESNTIACPRCEGQGTIRSAHSLGLSIVRLIEEEASKNDTNEVRVQLPVSTATFLLNEKRNTINELENKYNCTILLIPNPNMESPQYNIQRISGKLYNTNRTSHELIETKQVENVEHKSYNKKVRQPAAVKSQFTSATPKVENKTGENMLTKFIKSFFNSTTKVEEKTIQPSTDRNDGRTVNTKRDSQNRNNHQSQSRRNEHNKGRGSERRNDRNDRNDRNQPRNNTYNQQAFNKNKAQGNRRNQPHNNKNQNPRNNLHKSEEVIDISTLKAKANHKSKVEAITSNSTVIQPTSITTNRSDKISPMVRDVLDNCKTIAAEKSQQVETKTKSHASPKYINAETIELSLQQLKREQALAKEKAQRVAEEKAQRAAEEKAQPIVEEKAQPIVEEKAQPIVEEKAQPIVEEKAQPIVEEKAQPIVEEKAQPIVEEKAQPIVEEKAQPTVEEKEETIVEAIIEDSIPANSSVIVEAIIEEETPISAKNKQNKETSLSTSQLQYHAAIAVEQQGFCSMEDNSNKAEKSTEKKANKNRTITSYPRRGTTRPVFDEQSD